jgi:hypothetical protein
MKTGAEIGDQGFAVLINEVGREAMRTTTHPLRQARPLRLILVASVSLLLMLVASGPAAADQPVIETVSFSEEVPGFNFSCEPYGYSFDALATFTVTRRSIRFFEGSELVKEIRHVHFEGLLYRSDDLTATIPYAGTWTRTFDAVANTVTTSGLVRYSHPNGSGMVSMSAGHLVLDAETFEPISKEAGQTGAAWEAGVCAYLAAA